VGGYRRGDPTRGRCQVLHFPEDVRGTSMTALPTSGDAAHWFARWREGDPRAMDELVREMTPVLWHIARAYSVSAPVAEDVVQSTWLALVRKHDMIEDPAAVAGWLVTTVRREAWRAAGRARRSISEED